MTARPSAVSVPPWGLTLAAMLSVQLGSALSVDLIDIVGAAGTAWLRLSMGDGGVTPPNIPVASPSGGLTGVPK